MDTAAPGGSSIGRYRLHDEIGHGGMARVHLAQQLGAAGFSRVVAVKRIHPHLVEDASARAMFVDEARLSSRVVDPHVVRTLDVVDEGAFVAIVMEYVVSVSLAQLVRMADSPPPVDVAIALIVDLLRGLEAAHGARDAQGRPLGLVHRDVSPQNVLVGKDGLARVIDFGIAKGAGRLAVTATGETKGKQSYMAPEQLRGELVSRETDVWAAGVVAWELLSGRSLYGRLEDALAVSIRARLSGEAPAPVRSLRADVPTAVDDALRRALAPRPHDRFPTAKAFADSLIAACAPAPRSDVVRWVDSVAGGRLELAEERCAQIERAFDASVTEPAITSSSTSVGDPMIVTETVRMAELGGSRTKRPRWPIVAAVLFASALCGAIIRWRSTHREVSPAMGDPVSVAARPASSLESASSPAPSAPPAPPSTPAEVASVEGPPPSGRRAPVRASGPRTSNAGARPASSRCSPPYRLDASGHKIYLPECF